MSGEDGYRPEPGDAPENGAPPRWFDDVREAAAALRDLLAAQGALLQAELRLARSAAHAALVAALVATVAAVALGLTLLALLGWALAQWFGSWAWSLAALAGLLALALAAAIALFRRCLHWMTLPASRREWRTLVQETTASRRERTDDDEHAGPTR